MLTPYLDVPSIGTEPSVTLQWGDPNFGVDQEDNYLVERQDGTGAFVQIAAVGQNVVLYTDYAVSFGGGYTYRVRGYQSIGPVYSYYSNLRLVGIPLSGTPPGSFSGGVGYGINEIGMGYNTLICNNYMFNNGLGNLDPDFLNAPSITIDNPASNSLQVIRGVVIVP